MDLRSKRGRPLLILASVILLVLVVLLGVFVGAKYFVSQERAVRTVWQVDVGELLGKDRELGLELRQADVESDLTVLQFVPFEVEREGFTYYDIAVQDRLARAIEKAKARSQGWEAGAPLAVLNPYGTGNNGLYLYFTTDMATRVTYTVHVEREDIPDFTAVAAEASGETYTKVHEFQLIGLVPGETNQVTLTIAGSWGNVRQRVTFAITMPETRSGYPTRLDYTDGESEAPLSDGLFAMMRTNGYLGYGFFFDNGGILRYEMVLEGYGLDRILWYEGEMVTCVSATRLARLDGLGRVKQVYDLTGYELHHDIIGGPQGTVIALVNKDGSETVEDVVVEVDLETGTVTELLDFSVLMADYCFNETHPVPLTGDFFWQAGEWDWLHLNTVQYLEADDSLLVSSRETSTVLKVENAHSRPELAWLLGDPAFWAGTAYEDLSLTPEGDFTFPYGQHSVEYAGAGGDGTCYLRLFNNNYWSNSTRNYTPELDEWVSESLYGGRGDQSWVCVYRVDEVQRTFTLETSFAVPYSSIVSNAAPAGEDGNWVVNSGISNVYGEYDGEGELIREFAYVCTMQGYRTFKESFYNFWFQS